MIYPFFLQKIILPLSNLIIGRRFWFIHNKLQKSQWHTPASIRKHQLTQLKKLVTHAYDTVPLYKELLDKKKLKPSDIKTLNDLKKLPILTKDEFRKGFPHRCASTAVPRNKWMLDSTSGSTGRPFQFIRDKTFSDHALANTYRNYTWTGLAIGEKIASLWGYHKDPLPVKILDKLLRRKFYSSFDVEKNYRDYYASMKKYKPKLIEAYSASLTHFAKLLKEHKLTDLRIPFAISSAETLYPKHRRLIEKALHTSVFDRYGSREVGNVAHECDKHKGLHVNAETYIVEVVKDNPKDHKGRLIVTNLTNYAMPFIRYDTEDYAVPTTEHCPCRRGLPLLKSIEGRITDYLILPSGEELSFLFFNYFFEQYGAYVQQFQVVQDRKNHVTLNLVPTKKYSKQVEQRIKKGLQKKLKGMTITIKKVPSIPKERSGKIRPVKRLV